VENAGQNFYRAMHFSAKCGIAIACRLSVRPSVTLVDCDHIGRNSSKIISPLVSLGCGDISATGRPIHFMFCSRVGFSGTAGLMALFSI